MPPLPWLGMPYCTSSPEARPRRNYVRQGLFSKQPRSCFGSGHQPSTTTGSTVDACKQQSVTGSGQLPPDLSTDSDSCPSTRNRGEQMKLTGSPAADVCAVQFRMCQVLFGSGFGRSLQTRPDRFCLTQTGSTLLEGDHIGVSTHQIPAKRSESTCLLPWRMTLTLRRRCCNTLSLVSSPTATRCQSHLSSPSNR
jgi:hypothetical protein